jgi:hypothetical protein
MGRGAEMNYQAVNKYTKLKARAERLEEALRKIVGRSRLGKTSIEAEIAAEALQISDEHEEHNDETNDRWSLRNAGRNYDGSGESYNERNL